MDLLLSQTSITYVPRLPCIKHVTNDKIKIHSAENYYQQELPSGYFKFQFLYKKDYTDFGINLVIPSLTITVTYSKCTYYVSSPSIAHAYSLGKQNHPLPKT